MVDGTGGGGRDICELPGGLQAVGHISAPCGLLPTAVPSPCCLATDALSLALFCLLQTPTLSCPGSTGTMKGWVWTACRGGERP